MISRRAPSNFWQMHTLTPSPQQPIWRGGKSPHQTSANCARGAKLLHIVSISAKWPWKPAGRYCSSGGHCNVTWIYLRGTLTNQTSMHIFRHISHTSRQQWQHLRSEALGMFLPTTRNAWLHSTCFASQASSSQCLSKTSPAWASTPLITSGYVETTQSLQPHHIFLHPSSPALRASLSPWILCIILFSWNLTTKSALSVVLVGYYPWQPIIWVVPSR